MEERWKAAGTLTRMFLSLAGKEEMRPSEGLLGWFGAGIGEVRCRRYEKVHKF